MPLRKDGLRVGATSIILVNGSHSEKQLDVLSDLIQRDIIRFVSRNLSITEHIKLFFTVRAIDKYNRGGAHSKAVLS